MADELIDIVNEEDQKIGIQKMKSKAHKEGLWHRSAHVWIYDPQEGTILLQLRNKDKELYPDMWDISAAGHVSLNEEPEVSALRETQEELGIVIRAEDLQFFMIKKVSATYKDIQNNEFYYIYLLSFDSKKLNEKEMHIQKEEVQDIRFFTIEEIKKGLKSNPEKYVPHGEYWFEVMNEVQKRIEK